jgi:hypothetical protein
MKTTKPRITFCARFILQYRHHPTSFLYTRLNGSGTPCQLAFLITFPNGWIVQRLCKDPATTYFA